MTDKKEYIERDSVILDIEKVQSSLESSLDKEWHENRPYYKGLSWANKIVRDARTADVERVRHGKWIKTRRGQKSPEGYYYWNTPLTTVFVCSECGRKEDEQEPYCHCGAKMDGKGE